MALTSSLRCRRTTSARTIRDGRRKFWPLLRAAPLDARKRYGELELDELVPVVPADVDADADVVPVVPAPAVPAGAVVDTDADVYTGAVVDGSVVDADDDAEVANATPRDTDDDADVAASRSPSHGTVSQTALVSPALPTPSAGGAVARIPSDVFDQDDD